MDKKKMNKAVDPETVKLEKIGQGIEGKFVKIEKSGKYESGYALHFIDSKGVASVCFVNNQALGLIQANLTKGQEFILEFVELRDNEEKTQKYKVYELYY